MLIINSTGQALLIFLFEKMLGGILMDLNKMIKMKLLSCVRLFVTPWTIDYQGSLSMGFSRQEYWSGLLLPSPEDLPNRADGTCICCIGQWILYH